SFNPSTENTRCEALPKGIHCRISMKIIKVQPAEKPAQVAQNGNSKKKSLNPDAQMIKDVQVGGNIPAKTIHQRNTSV
ncbi:hypothetical protein ABTE16_20600, partial [Acinetobacter baumannii]